MADQGLSQNEDPDWNSISFSRAVAAWNHDLIAHSITGFTLALFFLSLRVYTRTRISKSFCWDDITMCLAMVFFTGYVIILLILAHWSMTGTHVIPKTGNDAYYTSPGAQDHRYGHRLFEASFLVFIVCVAWVRISIGLLFLRVSRQVRGPHRWFCHTFMWLTGITSIIIVFLVLFECSPFGTNIETDNPRLIHCLPNAVMPTAITVYAIMAIIVDLGLALLPAWLLWGVKMNKKTKAGTAFLMAMGLIASSAVFWRLLAMGKTGFQHLEKLSMDDGYELKIKVMISCIFEGSLGIQSASIATLIPLFKKIRDSYRSYFEIENKTQAGRTATSARDDLPSPLIGDHPGPLTSNPPNAFVRREAEYHQLEELHRTGSPPVRAVSPPFRTSLASSRAASPSFRADTYSFPASPSSHAASPSFPGSPTSFTPILDPEPPHPSPSPPNSPRLSEYNPTLPTIHSGYVLSSSETVSTVMSIPMSDLGSLQIPGTLTETASKANLSSPTTASIKPVV